MLSIARRGKRKKRIGTPRDGLVDAARLANKEFIWADINFPTHGPHNPNGEARTVAIEGLSETRGTTTPLPQLVATVVGSLSSPYFPTDWILIPAIFETVNADIS